MKAHIRMTSLMLTRVLEIPQYLVKIEERIIGITITNISLDTNDDNVRQFVSDYVSKDIDIVRDIKKVTVRISRKLNIQLSKINFS